MKTFLVTKNLTDKVFFIKKYMFALVIIKLMNKMT